jgi:hypothetical protein
MMFVWPSPLDGLGGSESKMHDLLIALAFIGMVLAPAIVAAKTDIEATDETE